MEEKWRCCVSSWIYVASLLHYLQILSRYSKFTNRPDHLFSFLLQMIDRLIIIVDFLASICSCCYSWLISTLFHRLWANQTLSVIESACATSSTIAFLLPLRYLNLYEFNLKNFSCLCKFLVNQFFFGQIFISVIFV